MDGSSVRNLLRRATTATLATSDAGGGHPYASLVEVATMPDGRPILLLSSLARHTRNLKGDDRVSLLVDQRHDAANPLATERTTIIGRARPTDDPTARRRYLARFPAADLYAAFADFGFWVVEIAAAHTIAGFGRIRELAGADVVLDGALVANLAAAEAELLARVNRHLGDAEMGAGHGRRAVGLDAEGIDVAGPAGLERVSFNWVEENEDCNVKTIIYDIEQKSKNGLE